MLIFFCAVRFSVFMETSADVAGVYFIMNGQTVVSMENSIEIVDTNISM